MYLRYRPPWPHNQGSNEGQDLTAKGDKNVWAVHPIISFISTDYLMLMRYNLSVHTEVWPNVGNVGSSCCLPLSYLAAWSVFTLDVKSPQVPRRLRRCRPGLRLFSRLSTSPSLGPKLFTLSRPKRIFVSGRGTVWHSYTDLAPNHYNQSSHLSSSDFAESSAVLAST